MDAKELDLFGVIAFDGLTRNGLRLHPDGEYLVYPIGSKVTIKHVKTGEQVFLAGHKNVISTLCISPRGTFVASGQVNHHGFKAMVIIWSYENREIKDSYEMHRIRVEDVCFTKDERYLISLGGRDDGRIVVWDVPNGTPLCATFAGRETSGQAVTIARTNIEETSFVTGGDGTFRVWRVDEKARRVHGVDVKLGKIRRAINCLVVDQTDEHIYCGTTSGDIMKSRLHTPESKESKESKESATRPIMIECYSKLPCTSKRKTNEGEVYAGGVTNLLLLREQKMIVGAGDGTVELVEITKDSRAFVGNDTKKLLVVPRIVTHRRTNVCAAVTSILGVNDQLIFVGTASSEIHEIELSSFRARLLVTCHTSTIYDLAFPRDRSEVFATTGRNDIRVWKVTTQKELLRITVPNFLCYGLCFDRNGGTIMSAWNDGAIRAFALNTGELRFAIERAHAKPVSTIAITNDDSRLISGGCDGQVRIWNAQSESRQLLHVLKEHRGPVTSLHVSPDDKSFVSSSTDGTCIVWDARSCTRKYALRGNTMYKATCFVPSGVQVLTCGTDRKIAYWETLDGSLVRQVEGSTTGTLNAISISRSGRYFLTGSDDFIVKLWDYRTANTVHRGLAHAAPITACAFAPGDKFMVTVSTDGAIMLWKYPYEASIVNNSESRAESTVCATRAQLKHSNKDNVVDCTAP